jgi:hypothetical protein
MHETSTDHTTYCSKGSQRFYLHLIFHILFMYQGFSRLYSTKDAKSNIKHKRITISKVNLNKTAVCTGAVFL